MVDLCLITHKQHQSNSQAFLFTYNLEIKLNMSLTTFLTFIMLQGIVAIIVPSEGNMPIIGKLFNIELLCYL